MRTQLVLHIILIFVCFHHICFSQPPQSALKNYIVKKDTAYNWKTQNVLTNADGRFYEVSLLSQRWQDTTWSHRLIIYFPNKAKHPNTVLLVLRHIYNRTAGLASLKIISDSTSTASALLYDMPNQPLFNGKEEDDLQAYTFSQYIKTGEESWPLLFPMVKSVVRAMDAVQGLASKEEKFTVNNFIVAGHSKRGHTSWLAAAVDGRVKGIIPIAIDVLNAPAQMPHHLKAFGAFSTPSKDATDFLKELKEPLGNRLIQMIDPYSYKEQLNLPKLIVSATNDEYFPTDALNLYWEGLKGNKSILYLSNAGHVRADSDPRINPTAFAFVRAVAAGKTLPSFNWEFTSSKDSLQLMISADTAALSAVFSQASSKNNDFRGSQWKATTMKAIDQGGIRQFVISIQKPSADNGLYFGEVEFEQDGHKFLLSTQTYRYTGK
jgi:PhoPQ-activated pathogenicity-related protein